MNEMSFSLRLGVKDDSQAGLRSWQSSVMGAARVVAKPITIPLKIGAAGLGLLRDINLGLRPLISGLDHVIERGTALDAVRKSFISLVGGGAKAADQLAVRLVAASHGTLRTAEAMQLANRAMAAGIDTARDLPTILDFASKKAITTGMDFNGAMERIVMGLSRGSAAILDDFGLLNDGLDGVKRTYEAIKGVGAWEQLGPAGQKVELIRQAMEDMHKQLGRLGVRGTETVFVWKQIKTQIGDATDKLFAAVGRSDTLRGALQGARDVLAGMTQHFEQGGSLGELLLGKKDSKSGGLLGGLKAGVLDVGEVIGRGILGGVLKGISLLPDLFNSAWAGLKKAWIWAIEELPPRIVKAFEWLKSDFLPALAATLTAWRQESIDALAGWLSGYMADEKGKPTWFGRAMGVDSSDSLRLRDSQPRGANGEPIGQLRAAWEGMKWGFKQFFQETSLGQLTGYQAPPPMVSYIIGKEGPRSFFEQAAESGGAILGGGVFAGKSRARGWLGDWREEYPAGGGRYIPGVPPPPGPAGMGLTAAGVGSRERSIRLLDREIRREEGLSRREARKAAGEQARELYRQGWEATPEDRARLEQENYEKISGFRTSQARKARDAIKAELEARRPRKTMTEDELAGIGRAVPREKAEGSKGATSLLSMISNSSRQQVELLGKLVAAFGGAETAINRAGAG